MSVSGQRSKTTKLFPSSVGRETIWADVSSDMCVPRLHCSRWMWLKRGRPGRRLNTWHCPHTGGLGVRQSWDGRDVCGRRALRALSWRDARGALSWLSGAELGAGGSVRALTECMQRERRRRAVGNLWVRGQHMLSVGLDCEIVQLYGLYGFCHSHSTLLSDAGEGVRGKLEGNTEHGCASIKFCLQKQEVIWPPGCSSPLLLSWHVSVESRMFPLVDHHFKGSYWKYNTS